MGIRRSEKHTREREAKEEKKRRPRTAEQDDDEKLCGRSRRDQGSKGETLEGDSCRAEIVRERGIRAIENEDEKN